MLGIQKNIFKKIFCWKKKHKTHIRSDNYRYNYIKNNPGVHGLYMCAYCGKIIPKKIMEVDHIVSIDYANTQPKFRYKNFDINGLNNLTSSCRKCNRRKSNHGGLWILRGKIGMILQPALWVLFILSSMMYTHFILTTFG